MTDKRSQSARPIGMQDLVMFALERSPRAYRLIALRRSPAVHNTDRISRG